MLMARNARPRYDDQARAERLTAIGAGVKVRPCAEGAWVDGGGLIGFKRFCRQPVPRNVSALRRPEGKGLKGLFAQA